MKITFEFLKSTLSMLCRRRVFTLVPCFLFVLIAGYLGKLELFANQVNRKPQNQAFRLQAAAMNAQSRLKAVMPTISELMSVSGSAGVSIGVLHHGEVVFTTNLGYQDLARKVRPTSDTLYWAGSIAKSFTAAAIGVLVEEEKLGWSSVVSDILPDFKHENQEVREKMDVTDLLSHRSGLGGKAAIWQRDHARVVISLEDFVKTTTYLPAVYPLRQVWMPTNWNYGLADYIVAEASGVSFGSYLRDKLFVPLQLHRTTIDVQPDLDNVAQGYFCSGTDDPPYPAERPQVGDGSIMAGAMGLKSSVNDLLVYFKALMHASKDQRINNTTSTAGSPFKQTQVLMQPHITITKNADGTPQAEFALGWVKTKLPNPMSEMGINEFYVKQFPVIGKGLKSGPEVFYHAGSVVGFLTSVTLIPETDSAVVVMSNTLGNQDFPDWVGLLLLEALLNVPDRVNFIPYAIEAAEAWANAFPKMKEQLDQNRDPKTPSKPSYIYPGQYWNAVGTWYFDIFQEQGDETLWMAYCGIREDKYRLAHYHDNTLIFEIDYQESVRRGLWPVPSADFYLLNFQNPGQDGIMTESLWKYDWQEPGGEIFRRRESHVHDPRKPHATL